MKNLFVALIMFLSITSSFAQNAIYNHFFMTPYLFNPAYVGSNGYVELNILARQQWTGVEGAPVTYGAALQVPINYNLSAGLIVLNDEAGLITNTTGMLSVGYGVRLATDHVLRLGISAGVGNNSYDDAGIDDPVFDDAANNSFYMDGSAGITYSYKFLTVGFALPQLFPRKVIQDGNFTETEITGVSSTFTSLSAKLPIGESLMFQPYGIYRTEDGYVNQYEAAGLLYIKNMVWFGGGYRQNYGPMFFVGLKILDRFSFGYSYELANELASEFGTGTHEFQINLRLGKKNKLITDKAVKEQPAPVVYLDELAEEPVEEVPVDEQEVVEPTQPQTLAAAIDASAEQAPQPIVNEAVTTEKIVNEPPVVVAVIDEALVVEEVGKAAVVEEVPKAVVVEEVTLVEEVTENEAAPVVEEVIVKEEVIPIIEPEVIVEPEAPKERIETVKRGSTNGDLAPGTYVVVGVFGQSANALRYADNIRRAGYAAKIGHNSVTGYHYVYSAKSETLNAARKTRDVLRKIDRFQFPDTWILNVED